MGDPQTAPARLSEVVAAGDRRASLEALRDHLALQLEDCPAGATAGISKQLTDVLLTLDTLGVPKGSKVDDLSKRRAARRAGAAGADSS